MVKNPKIWSCDLNIWPMTLKFSRVLAVIKVHVREKFIELSAAVHELQREKNSAKNNTVIATVDSNNII